MTTALPPIQPNPTVAPDVEPMDIAVEAVSLPDPARVEAYDPEAIAARYRLQPLRVFWRWIQILIPVVSLFLSRWWDQITGQTGALDTG